MRAIVCNQCAKCLAPSKEFYVSGDETPEGWILVRIPWPENLSEGLPTEFHFCSKKCLTEWAEDWAAAKPKALPEQIKLP